jgi:hypothetical protein
LLFHRAADQDLLCLARLVSDFATAQALLLLICMVLFTILLFLITTSSERHAEMNTKEMKLYETEISVITRELDKLPEGHLTKQKTRYYQTIGKIQKGITKEQALIMQLARKAYLLQRLKNIEWNQSLAKKQSGRYKTEDPAEIIRGLPSFYGSLPSYYFFHPSVHEKFDREYERYAGYTENLVFLTRSGIHVRSKSERAIADALYQNGIPFRYEAAHTIGGQKIHPDFTIDRPYDGKLFLWEHFGLLDDHEYRKTMIRKITLYAQYGFNPFNNLIYTYEQDIHDPACLQTIIELMLVRYYARLLNGVHFKK